MSSISLLLGRDPGGANIDRSVQTWNYVCQSLCIVGMTVCFCLRLYTRIFVLNGFNKEDCECPGLSYDKNIYKIMEVSTDSIYRDLCGRLGKTTRPLYGQIETAADRTDTDSFSGPATLSLRSLVGGRGASHIVPG